MARQREGQFKTKAKKIIFKRYPGCFMHEMKCGDQGIPDTLILYNEYWALLEFKDSEFAERQPNQAWYVDRFNRMGFSAFVYPENFDYILEQLDEYFDV